MNLIETTPPEAEPLTLEEAKAHLRITHDADDDVINALIRAARGMCENDTGLALITRGYSLYLDVWERGIVTLPNPLLFPFCESRCTTRRTLRRNFPRQPMRSIRRDGRGALPCKARRRCRGAR